MKKQTFLFIVMLTVGQMAQSQQTDLAQFYKNEAVILEEVASYATSNNWEEVFSPPVDQSFGKDLGERKRIVVAPDGSVFMSHKTRHEIWKFDASGKLVMKFGKKGSKPGEFVMLPTVEGFLDGKYLYTMDVHGRIQFYDLHGNYIKSLKLDYMPLDSRPLANNKIAFLGHVPWADGRTRYIISLKDFETGNEEIIWSVIEGNNKGQMSVKTSDGGMLGFSMPHTHPSTSWPRIATSKTGKLIVADPASGKVTEFTPLGEKRNSFSLNMNTLPIEQEKIEEYYQKGKENIKKFEEKLRGAERYNDQEIKDMVNQYAEQVEKLNDRDQYPEHLPQFTNMLIDSDGNLLFFEYTEDRDSNQFRVYSYNSNGKFLSKSSFVSDDYYVNFAPGAFVFHNGEIINVAKKKSGNGNLMRLVKFTLK